MILGRFYLRKNKDGNLIGEFSNYRMNRIITEEATLISEQNLFRGTYNSNWLEDDGREFSTLNIEFAFNENTRIYNLIWNINGAPRFYGQGFTINDILIGDYMDEPMRTYLRNAPNNPLNF